MKRSIKMTEHHWMCPRCGEEEHYISKDFPDQDGIKYCLACRKRGEGIEMIDVAVNNPKLQKLVDESVRIR